jgi:hypothetical protein
MSEAGDKVYLKKGELEKIQLFAFRERALCYEEKW